MWDDTCVEKEAKGNWKNHPLRSCRYEPGCCHGCRAGGLRTKPCSWMEGAWVPQGGHGGDNRSKNVSQTKHRGFGGPLGSTKWEENPESAGCACVWPYESMSAVVIPRALVEQIQHVCIGRKGLGAEASSNNTETEGLGGSRMNEQ